jgi:hypothetical protein
VVKLAKSVQKCPLIAPQAYKDRTAKKIIIFRHPQGEEYLEKYRLRVKAIAPFALIDVSVDIQ